MIANGNTYCKIASFGPILPPEYQEVEYIKNSGTQYINTNYIPNFENGFEINVEYIPENSSSRGCLLSNYGSTPYHISFEVRDSFRQRFYYNNGAWDNSISGVKILNERNIGLFKYIDGVFYHTLNGTTQSYNYISPELCNKPLLMFVDINKRFATFTNYLKIYKCSIKDNNTLVRNFIPCYRKSDNEIGMYDTVNGVFYTNQGSGTFLKGNNVVHTIRYKIPTEERPYISGHVTDGSSTFTFTVNGNESITVPVDSNGNWKWVVDRTVTSLNQSFNTKFNISEVTINCLKDVTDMTQIFRAGSAETTLTKVEFKNCDFNKVTSLNGAFNNRRGLVSVKGIDSSKFESNVNLMYTFIYCYKLQFPENFKWSNIITNKTSDMRYAFADCRTIINESTYYGGTIDCSNATPTKLNCAYMNCFVDKIILPIITSTCTVTNAFDGALRLVDIEAQSISTSLDLRKCSRLNKQSIINLTNASQANVTYTLHSTVYNKCASGGEWYTDVQAAIDAKAQQGYTVTLISA